MSAPQRIQNGSRVELGYRLTDGEGGLVESSDDTGPMEFEIGAEEIFPALEAALLGLVEGDERTVVLEPEEAFGEIDLEAVISVPLEALPEGVLPRVGDLLPILLEPEEGDAEGAEPEEVEAVVREVNDDGIVLDTNHPLAGHRLTFDLKVLRVR